MDTYTAGIAYNETGLLLVLKDRPAWQSGNWNAIGGRVEYGEFPIDAMVREFHEETSIRIERDSWKCGVVLNGDTWHVHFFATRLPSDFRKVTSLPSRNDVGETLSWILWPSFWGGGLKKIWNLNWIVPLCIDGAVSSDSTPVYVQYKPDSEIDPVDISGVPSFLR